MHCIHILPRQRPSSTSERQQFRHSGSLYQLLCYMCVHTVCTLSVHVDIAACARGTQLLSMPTVAGRGTTCSAQANTCSDTGNYNCDRVGSNYLCCPKPSACARTRIHCLHTQNMQVTYAPPKAVACHLSIRVPERLASTRDSRHGLPLLCQLVLLMILINNNNNKLIILKYMT